MIRDVGYFVLGLLGTLAVPLTAVLVLEWIDRRTRRVPPARRR